MEINPFYYKSYEALGFVNIIKEKDYKAAIEMFDMGILLSSETHCTLLLGIAISELKLGNLQSAKDYYDEAYDADENCEFPDEDYNSILISIRDKLG